MILSFLQSDRLGTHPVLSLVVVSNKDGVEEQVAFASTHPLERLERFESDTNEYLELTTSNDPSIKLAIQFLRKPIMDDVSPQEVSQGDQTNSEEKQNKADSESYSERRGHLYSLHVKVISLYGLDSGAHQLAQLGHGYHALYRDTSEIADLDQAISLYEQAIRSSSPSDPGIEEHSYDLSVALYDRFAHNEDRADIDRAICLYRDALTVTSVDDPNKLALSNGLALCLKARFSHFDEVADLDEVISIWKDAVEHVPDDHPKKLSFVDNLGRNLLTRFERLGNIEDLEQSISLKRGAVDLTPDGHASRPSRLNSLGEALQSRFERLVNIMDLEETISLQKIAVSLASDEDRHTPAILSHTQQPWKCLPVAI